MTTSSQQKHSVSDCLRILFITAGLVTLTSGPAQSLASTTNAPATVSAVADQQTKPGKAKIQLAILLDTSGSMNGLIDQARNQLWQAVNEFSKARLNGAAPSLEVAVYEYGNDRLPADKGHIRQVTGLTQELDQVSEALFSLSTDGGSEYCGYVIDTAVRDLDWSPSENAVKAIFIAGNEPFTQGPVAFGTALAAARRKGITVNTIHAGGYQEGAQTGWKEGARLAGGNYMSIDHNHRVAHIVAPQDRKIAELNARLNGTYLPYGAQGQHGVERQRTQDAASGELSLGLLAQRIQSKVSSMYNNAKWDLVDALDSGAVKLEKLDDEQLPAEMRSMTTETQRAYIEGKAAERKNIQQEIVTLSKAREAFVAGNKRQAAEPGVNTLNEALTSAIREQGRKKQFVFQGE